MILLSGDDVFSFACVSQPPADLEDDLQFSMQRTIPILILIPFTLPLISLIKGSLFWTQMAMKKYEEKGAIFKVVCFDKDNQRLAK